MKRLGLVGLGQFGQLAARTLKDHFDVVATDAAPDAPARASAAGVAYASLEEVAGCEIVVVAVPVAVMREVFGQIAPLVKPGALVIDVGSVKVLPVTWMQELLPAHVEIVATHPLFGPQSVARDGLPGLRFVVCPVRGERFEKVAAFGRSLGLAVTVTTAEEHDREMAYVQALTHLIGRSLVNLGIPDEELATPSYQHLLELCGLIRNDTFELFAAIQTQNPYAPEVAKAFVAQAQSLLEQVASGKTA
ncbi:prephenate dehydrogenase/arogenate dehydrogenase family protein [Phenylobacterium soli]|uniref:Prephenate dehydrogenase/arogenate dehydrogenase family protein n=1 Tax=Phenylobacterium soli TaxID=2170551 RepID=A0A328AHM6_9CAUL|nr:prephenate dehydrogenase/arogenate dehydrogenase family protein [Phenylobacterium soli]RAK54413.1 prephenate dehydrogenase/arogenate dehydrogenase family protein [Phenylobacterium soli]